MAQSKPKYKSFHDTVFVVGDKIRTPVILFSDGRFHEKANDSLAVIANFLKANPNVEVEIGYFTDTRGSDLFNKKLSIARAQGIVDKLSKDFGIPVKQIVPYGYGEAVPIYTDEQIKCEATKEKQEAMHQVNRRCEIKVLSVAR